MPPPGTYPTLPELDATDYGVVTESTDVLAGLNTGITAANGGGGGVLRLPPGVLLASPNGTGTYIEPKSDVTVRGCGPGTILRVNAGTGNYEKLFGNAGTAVTNFCLEDLTIDLNGANCSGTLSTTSGQNRFAFILGNATGIRFRNVRFLYWSVNALCVAGTNCQDISVENCYFEFQPKTSPEATDNSAIYIEADNYNVVGNRFKAAIGSGARGAIELHDANGTCTGNSGIGYQSAIHVVNSAGSTPQYTGHTISGNSFVDLGASGVLLWPIAGKTMRGVTVTGNTMAFKQATHGTTLSCIGIGPTWNVSQTGDIEGLTITGNTVIFEDEGAGRAVTSEFLHCGINLGIYGGTNSGAVVNGNVVIRAPGPGIRACGTQAGTALKGAKIANNVIVDAGQNAGITVNDYRVGITLENVMTDVDIDGNVIRDTGAASLKGKYAIEYYGGGTMTNVRVRRNVVNAASGASYPLVGLAASGITGDGAMGSDRGDNSVTLVWGVDSPVQRFATTLTANRTITLSSANVHNGASFRVFRTGLGAFTLDVGGVKTIPSATAAFVDVTHDGTAWRLTGYGTL